MICPNCGRPIADDVQYCPYCGTHLKSDLLPVNEPPLAKDEDKAGHVLGVLSIVFGVFTLGYVGLVLGIIGVNISKKGENRALAIAGIVISGIFLILSAITMAAYHD